MASGHVNRTNRPNTWLHRPNLQLVKKALANSEPSTHGTDRRKATSAHMSALEGTSGLVLLNLSLSHFDLADLRLRLLVTSLVTRQFAARVVPLLFDISANCLAVLIRPLVLVRFHSFGRSGRRRI